MHVKRLKPLAVIRVAIRIPVLSPTTSPTGSDSAVQYEEVCQVRFHVGGYVPGVVSGVSVPCSHRVPRCEYPTITGKKPWSTPFKPQ